MSSLDLLAAAHSRSLFLQLFVTKCVSPRYQFQCIDAHASCSSIYCCGVICIDKEMNGSANTVDKVVCIFSPSEIGYLNEAAMNECVVEPAMVLI